MFILAHFVQALATVVQLGLTVYLWMIVIRAILSWVNPDPYHPVVRFLYRATDPVMDWVRNRLPVYSAGMDWSPIIIIAAVYFLRNFLVTTLMDIARRLQ
jgi:YggT family protein